MSILSALLDAGTQSEDAVRPPLDGARRTSRAFLRRNAAFRAQDENEIDPPRLEGAIS